MQKFRILSLDGGGVRGAYSASVLAEIQRNMDQPISKYFDLIVGTSTGGILAIGLGTGVTPDKIVEFYEEFGPKIFPITNWLGVKWNSLRQLVVGNKNDSDILQESLKNIYQESILGSCNPSVVVVSYNATRDGPHLFKSHDDRHKHLMAYQIAMATSAAPLYFQAIDLPLGQDRENQTFVDGGVWANCPVLVGIAEAVSFFGKRLDEIEVLSIGTTYKPFRIKEKHKEGSLVDWSLGRDLAAFIGSAQEAGSFGTARTMLGENNIHRITNRQAEHIPLDDASKIEELIALGKYAAQQEMSKVKAMFFK